MIAQDAQGSLPLITFRLPQRPDRLRKGEEIEALQLEPHRPAYLTYEGAVSGGRGQVRREASGHLAFHSRGDEWRIGVQWQIRSGSGGECAGVFQEFELVPLAGGKWSIFVAAGRDSGGKMQQGDEMKSI